MAHQHERLPGLADDECLGSVCPDCNCCAFSDEPCRGGCKDTLCVCALD